MAMKAQRHPAKKAQIERGIDLEMEVTPPEHRVYAWTLALRDRGIVIQVQQSYEVPDRRVFVDVELPATGQGPAPHLEGVMTLDALEQLAQGLLKMAAAGRQEFAAQRLGGVKMAKQGSPTAA